MTRSTITRSCRICGCRMHPQTGPGLWRTRHAGRGLCVGCLRPLQGTDELYNYPRVVTRPRDELLDDWQALRPFCTYAEAAQKLDMNVDSFKRALERARADGDPRAEPCLYLMRGGRKVLA